MNHRDLDLGLFEIVVGGVAGVIAVGTFVVWAPVELAARLTHGHWPRIGLGDVAGIAWHWVTHPAEPLGGWPAAARSDVPDARIYVVLVVLELVLVVVLAVAGLRLWLRWYGSRFARMGGGPGHETPIPKEQRV